LGHKKRKKQLDSTQFTIIQYLIIIIIIVIIAHTDMSLDHLRGPDFVIIADQERKSSTINKFCSIGGYLFSSSPLIISFLSMSSYIGICLIVVVYF